MAPRDRAETAAARPAATNPRSIAGMFDAIAHRYDFLNHLLSAGLDRRWRDRAIDALALDAGERLLDVCTGTGDLALAARAAAGRRVFGVDFAPEMLRVAQAKVAAAGAGIGLVRGDAVRLPVSSEAVDAVTIAFGIRNVADRAGACRELLRVLKPGGRLAVLEFGLPRTPGLRFAYLLYFRRLLPRIGAIVARHAHAYAYLPESVGTFPEPEAFADQLASIGFDRVHAIGLTCGVVYLYVARKPAAGLV